MRVLASMKYGLRVAFAYALFFSGILTLLKRMRLRNRMIVLMYHRVLTNEEYNCTHSTSGIVVSRDTFRRHLAFLGRHFRILGPDSLLDHLHKRRALPSASCLITFDDGWSDNYRNAYPLLKQAGIPATIFLPTSFIGTQRQFWQERMTRLLAHLHCLVRQGAAVPPIGTGEHDLQNLLQGTDDEVRAAIDGFVRNFKKCSMRDIDAFLDALTLSLQAGNVSPPDAGIDGFMNWDHVRQMAQDGITFGSHAVTHRLLDQLAPDELEKELTESRAVIEQQLGRPVRLLAYPNGNYTADVARYAEQCGYAAAFTTRPGTVSATDDPFALARINVHEALRHPPVLLAFMVGAFGTLS